MSAEAGMPGRVDCDLLVVGSGAGGLSAAVTAAWHGLEVAVAEKEPVLGCWTWAPPASPVIGPSGPLVSARWPAPKAER